MFRRLFPAAAVFGALIAIHPLGIAEALPPPVERPVDFEKDIKPLFEAACIKCHASGKAKGGFSLETRAAFLKGGDLGAGAIPGKSAESYVVELVAGVDPDEIMPKKGTRWTPEQVGLLRAWIDQDMPWPSHITFAKPPPENFHRREVKLAAGAELHPVDQLLQKYWTEKSVKAAPQVDDRTFARRAYLDLIGLLPTPAQLEVFLLDEAWDKRAKLVRTLLADRSNYADHWLTFWNDLLRNDYKGVGFIDGGRKQISNWLRQALVENKPYDQFVAELVNPQPESEGFARGIIWRGSVNASMLPPMQAAQSVSQVFLGVNIKCAACHDSFVSDWSLEDAYGLAAVYADEQLELVHCDKPTGKTAAMKFLYPELGGIDPKLPKAQRLDRLAGIMTSDANGRLARTVVNRLWARLMGRGIVEPLDDMEKPAWSRDLLDWLAEDLVAHKYDLKRTLEVIATSAAYQSAVVGAPREKEEYVFQGPFAKRLGAEQFCDALSQLTGDWTRQPSSLEFDFLVTGELQNVRLPEWIWTDEPVALGPQRDAVRAARGEMDASLKALEEARKSADAAISKGGAEIESARQQLASASAAIGKAQERLTAALTPPPALAPEAGKRHVLPPGDRHRLAFRKKFNLDAVPTEAYGTILASQTVQVHVNGQEAKPIQRDGFRNGRIMLLNLQPLLKVGANVVAIDVNSHTDKSMNDDEKKLFPASTMHLNAQSGIAFYMRGGAMEIVTDSSWRVRRNPEGTWKDAALVDAEWASATALPAGVTPVDEAPSLEPISRQDFSSLPVMLGPQLRPAVSIAAQPGRIRAALTAADPLQVALERPNREVIVPVRATAPTTIQALELTNGATLNERLQTAAVRAVAESGANPAGWLERLYVHGLSRKPTQAEAALAAEIIGSPMTSEGAADLLWAMVNLPEFQLIR